MSTFKAVVTQDIPANRLINLAGSGSVDDRDPNTIYLQTGKLGSIPDLVSTGDLAEGDEVDVVIRNNPIWTVEAAQNLPAGTLVQCAEGGRVKVYRPEDGSYVGFTTHAAEAGEPVAIVRKSGTMPQTQIESMSIDFSDFRKVDDTPDNQQEDPDDEQEAPDEGQQEAPDDEYPKHTGGGWYELSNGAKVQGEENAHAEEAALKEGDN